MSAWSFGYYRHGFTATTDRQKAGLHAVKAGLVANGFGTNINLAAPVFGDAATARTKDFQAAHTLNADGVIGPKTARYLWRHYVNPTEKTFGIPDHWLGKLCTLESNNDPVAEGTIDPDDEGLVKIHLPFHPEITLVQAWSPPFVVPWAGNVLQRTRISLGSWKATIASWNIGLTYARMWGTAGFPTTGGPDIGGEDAFARATRYVDLVSQQPY